MKKSLLIVALLFCQFAISQTIVDYRDWQSPVKDQANRGTCTAFAVISALETLPGFPQDLSEQNLFANAKIHNYRKMREYNSGSFLKFYIEILELHGALREDQETYQPNSEIWTADEETIDKMKKDLGGSNIYDLFTLNKFSYKIFPKMYSYREGIEAQDIEWIKKRLDSGSRCIPVSYQVNGNYWFKHKGDMNDMIHPNDFLLINDKKKYISFSEAKKLYGALLLSMLKKGEIEAIYTDSIYTINAGHSVAIVGYTNNGFLIKNSWGTNEWGDEGYGWVSFDYHSLYASEVLDIVLGKVSISKNSKEPEALRPFDFRLKSIPYEFNDRNKTSKEKVISLSVVYYGDGIMPTFKEIYYEGFDENGNKLGSWYGNTNGIFDGRESGFECYLLNSANLKFNKIHTLKAKFTTKKGLTFENTYRHIEPKNKEYRASLF